MQPHTRTLRALGALLALATLAACGGDDNGIIGAGAPTATRPDTQSTTPPTTPPGGRRATVTLSGNLLTTRTLTPDTAWVLSGFYKVRSGGVLRILPGTVIVGDTTVPGSSLWITQGGKIDAQGTAASPIVFTSQRPVGQRAPGDWGGIVIVGRAIANRSCPNAANPACVQSTLTEGPAGGGQNTAESYAGGGDPNDDSGTLRYVRIEFAGYAVQENQELNALSMYAVGRGTTIEYVQAMSGLDDSFEWFGGTVDGRYLVSYEAGDDHFDWTEGYGGRNQFLIALQTYRPTPRAGAGFVSSDPRGFEGDGCENDKAGCPSYDTAPFSMPVFANFTLVGPGAGVFPGVAANNATGATIRRGSGGVLVNGVIARFQGTGLNVVDAQTDQRRLADSLLVSNVLLAGNAGGNFNPAGTNFGQATSFPANEDSPADASTLFAGLPAAGATPTLATLDWTPAAGSPLRSGGLATFPARVTARAAGFFGGALRGTAYRGAVDPSGARWWQGWTSYARN